jgi:tetratricopeptide (TPR) repeat protein
MNLLDRLMARQAKLIASLDTPPTRASDRRTAPNAAPDPVVEAAASAAAQSAIDAGDLSTALTALTPFIPSGRNVQTFTTLARVYTEQGNFPRAVEALERAEWLDPSDRVVWQLIAKLLATQGRHREALVYLRRLALVDINAPASAYVAWLRGLLRARDSGIKETRVARALRGELKGVLDRFRAAPGKDVATELQFASLYYLLSDGSPEAVDIYNSAAPCPPTHHDVTTKLVSLDKWCLDHSLPELPAGESGQRVFTLKNVQVHRALDWSPVLEEGRILAMGGHDIQSRHFQAAQPFSPLLLFRGTRAELRLQREIPVEEEPSLLIGGSASYYDTVVNAVAGFAVAEASGLSMDLPIVVPAGMAPFQRELLELLGYAGNRLVEVPEDQPLLFRSLHVPSRLARASRSIAPLIGAWYCERLARSGNSGDRRLFLKPGPDVAVANIGALTTFFEALGFACIDASDLSVSSLIPLFSSAKVVVSATSEALTNIVFCPPGTRILELRPVHWVASGGQMHFEQLSVACGHVYAVEECARAGSDRGLSVVVEIERLGLREEHLL